MTIKIASGARSRARGFPGEAVCPGLPVTPALSERSPGSGGARTDSSEPRLLRRRILRRPAALERGQAAEAAPRADAGRSDRGGRGGVRRRGQDRRRVPSHPEGGVQSVTRGLCLFFVDNRSAVCFRRPAPRSRRRLFAGAIGARPSRSRAFKDVASRSAAVEACLLGRLPRTLSVPSPLRHPLLQPRAMAPTENVIQRPRRRVLHSISVLLRGGNDATERGGGRERA